MNKGIAILIAAAGLGLSVLPASAQATRTWVSGVGSDANPCSRTAPCITFAGAISKTAAGGEIDCLDPGGFGAVTITKSLTIDGTTGAGFGSILASATNGVNVNDSASGSPNTINVYLKNLSINGAGTTAGLVGINISSGREVKVENCTIFGFRSGNGNGIRDVRTAVVSNPPFGLWVYDTKITNSLNAAIEIQGSNGTGYRAVLNNVRIYGNASHGVNATNGAVQIRNSDISGNLGTAIRVKSGALVNVISTSLNGNGIGINNINGVCNMADITIMQNGTGFQNTGTSVSFGNNNVRDNGA